MILKCTSQSYKHKYERIASFYCVEFDSCIKGITCFFGLLCLIFTSQLFYS